ncbi:capsule biosynthesis protein [Vannielia sp.]|uniref:capsule biosynthesis protein n=1 Tax=Vannielia sp. TaxID=2813045 RepID=UPI002636E0D8|nr:capsule biosynthesis protein [Vannielia sp.]MDF1873338.1 capsule biosynthesis protein [Vannielia sp.]
MTTKPKASKFRIKRDAPLTPGQAAMAATDGATARKIEQAAPAATPPSKPTPSAGVAEGEKLFETHDDGFGHGMMDEPSPGSAAAQKGQSGQNGEVTSAASAASEATIADIRKEGLTGRQLRMARRVAQKHGLAPTSDFDAVKQLRDRGIDPFKRANMLELVQDNAKGQLPAGQAQPNLPQVANPGPGTQVGMPAQQPQLNPLEQRASEIGRIQRDIAKRRRRKSALLFTRLAIFVLLPTFIAGWYYYMLATPMYATKSEFLIQQAEAQSGAMGLGGLFQGTGMATQQDSTTVQSYLQSEAAMRRLDKDHGFKAAFQQPDIDPVQRLDEDATDAAAYRIYQKRVKIGYDPTEGILKMEVIAPTPELSETFSVALLSYAEERVDQLTSRLRGDQMTGAQESFDVAEQRVLDAQQEVLRLQEELGVLDPVGESASIQSQVTQFEVEVSQKQLDLEQQLSNRRPNEARVKALEGEIGRLEDLIANLRARMTQTRDGNSSLAKKTGELRIAEANLQTRQLLLQQAAAQMESARIEANRQVRFLSLGVPPVAPDEAAYPKAFENTLLALFIFSGIYLMISLTASILREQVAG